MSDLGEFDGSQLHGGFQLSKGFQIARKLIPPATPGRTRLLRHLLGSSIECTDVWLNTAGGVRIKAPSLREPIAFHLLISGVYEPQTLQLLKQVVPSDGVMIDVGANIGAVTIPMARTGARVIAAEASPKVLPYLQENIDANDSLSIDVIAQALSNESGYLRFFESPDSHFGMGSVGAQFHASPIEVKCTTLDSEVTRLDVKSVDAIKIDVEGAELMVLQGAENVLRQDPSPLVVFEFCDWAEARIPGLSPGAAQKYLLSMGFQIWRLGDYLRGELPLLEPVLSGSEMLVATNRR